MTERIGTRELRADLAAHLRRAGAGQRVVVTSGGRPLAALGPVEADNGRGAVTLDALVAAGLLIPPRRASGGEPRQPVPVWSGIRLDRVLREVRG